MTSLVRTATIDDAETACLVLRRSITECCAEDHRNDLSFLEAWLGNKTPESVRRWIQSLNIFSVVAEDDVMIVGFAMASSSGEVMLCYVVPEVRFTGTGKAMLHAIEAYASAAGIDTLHLESTDY